MYQLFSLISYLMLVPSLMYTSINRPCYKEDSFKKLDQYFSEESVLFIDLCHQFEKIGRYFTNTIIMKFLIGLSID